jgi:hypothetical protein
MRLVVSELRDRVMPARIAKWLEVIDATRALYRREEGRELALLRPRRFGEKMQWRKLFDLNPDFAIFSDKYATRQFVADRLGAEYLPELLWFGRDPDQIPFDSLPAPFVLKSTHGYGHVEIVETGAAPDVAKMRASARQWLAHNHGTAMGEPGYEHVPPGLIIEGLLLDERGEPPPERKIFVFDGKAHIIETILVASGDRDRTTGFHTPDWTRLPWRSSREPHPGDLPRPERLNEMLTAAERLAAGLDHLRVDFYDCGQTFRVGELTVYSWSGLPHFQPDGADEILGDYWRIPFPMTRAIMAVLFRQREIRPRIPSATQRDPVMGEPASEIS